MPRFLDVLNVTPLPDGLNWRYNSVFRYSSDLLGITIVSPVNRITDFTSSPQAIWNEVPPWGRHAPAACIHDECYWTQQVTREEADNVLREAMELLAVEEGLAEKIYLAVRLFGQHAWDRNAQLKASGYSRLASSESSPPYAAI